MVVSVFSYVFFVNRICRTLVAICRILVALFHVHTRHKWRPSSVLHVNKFLQPPQKTACALYALHISLSGRNTNDARVSRPVDVTRKGFFFQGSEPFLSCTWHHKGKKSTAYLAIIGFATASVSLSFAKISSSSAPGFESSHWESMNTRTQQHRWRRRNKKLEQTRWAIELCSREASWIHVLHPSTETKSPVSYFRPKHSARLLTRISLQRREQCFAGDALPDRGHNTYNTKIMVFQSWSSAPYLADILRMPRGSR